MSASWPRAAASAAHAGAAALLLLGAGVALGQQPLPPSTTPGGALPSLDQLLPARAPPPVNFPVPPVAERPLAVDEGERVLVRGFRLQGVTDRAALGVSAQELAELVEKLRVDRQGLTDVGEAGFTPDERADIAAFMQSVVTNPDQDMLFEDYQALVDRLRAERRQRDAGMTIGQLQEIANAVTEYYRSAGFILAQAYVPAQDVREGQVTIEVVEGTLSQVVAEGNERYTEALLAEPFSDIIDAPVTAQSVESRLLTLSDYPGLSVLGIFQPGDEVGTSDLLLRVQDERPFVANLRFDNHGTRFTGERRVYADVTWNNPTGTGDRAMAAALQQFSPSNSFFGSVEYERPLWEPGMTAGARYSTNPFDVGGELRELGLSGRSKTLDVWMRGAFERSRERNVYGQVGISRKQATTSINKQEVFRDELSVLGASLDYDDIDRESRAINFASIGVDIGLGNTLGGNAGGQSAAQTVPPSRQTSAGKFADNAFWKATGSFSRLANLNPEQTLLMRLEGQYSPSLLTSLEQYSIGGVSNVRAYPESEHLVDTALFASLEWSFNVPRILGFGDQPAFAGRSWGDVLRLSFFSDWAWGQINEPTAVDEQTASFAGVGSGLQFSLPGQLTSRLQVARPVGTSFKREGVSDGRPSDDELVRWWFDLTYTF